MMLRSTLFKCKYFANVSWTARTLLDYDIVGNFDAFVAVFFTSDYPSLILLLVAKADQLFFVRGGDIRCLHSSA